MFGKILRSLRESHNYSMSDLIEIYNRKFCGKMNKSTLSRYENGLQDPMYTVVVNLAEIFNVSVDYLSGTSSPITIPVLGYVRAGIPITAVEDILDYEEITPEMASQGEHFALKIKGDSMEPRIADGDVVIVRKQSDAENGDVAVVLVNGDEATVKKIKKQDNGISLIPLNPAYDIMYYGNEEIESLPVQIIGKVVELRAKF